MQARPVVLCAMRFGYGPAAKAIAVAAECRIRGISPIFLGNGIACELAERSQGVFSDVIRSDAHDPRAARVVRSASAIVSVMDREFAQLAGSMGTPLYVIDSLLWMRDHVPSAFDRAARYWAQRFVDVPEGPPVMRARPIAVGPVVARPVARTPASNAPLVVQLGGVESPLAEGDSSYAAFVIEALLGSRLGEAFVDRIMVIAGAGCVDQLRGRFGEERLRCVSLSHADATRECANAAMVLTAPGMTSTLECFQSGVPTYFLPPQNYSQWCILRTLRGRSLAPHAFHWEDAVDDGRLEVGMPEAVRNPRVREMIDAHTASEEIRRRVQDGFSKMLEDDRAALSSLQRLFFESLGENGAVSIADELTEAARGAA